MLRRLQRLELIIGEKFFQFFFESLQKFIDFLQHDTFEIATENNID